MLTTLVFLGTHSQHTSIISLQAAVRGEKMLILQLGSLLGYLVQIQVKFNFISLLQLFLLVCNHDMFKIPHHSMTAHNCCAVPASPQHVRLKHLGVVTAGGENKVL